LNKFENSESYKNLLLTNEKVISSNLKLIIVKIGGIVDAKVNPEIGKFLMIVTSEFDEAMKTLDII